MKYHNIHSKKPLHLIRTFLSKGGGAKLKQWVVIEFERCCEYFNDIKVLSSIFNELKRSSKVSDIHSSTLSERKCYSPLNIKFIYRHLCSRKTNSV